MTHQSPPLLRVEGIEKSFPGVRALRGVQLVLHPGEVLGIVGENGAGKSTLIKVLAGAHQPDSGLVELSGRPVRFADPIDAQRAGIAVIYQEFNLVPSLTVRENIFLGHETGRGGFFSAREERREAHELLHRLRASIDPDVLCRNLSVAEQQIVEIAKALSQGARILVMDEPSAALTISEVRRLFDIVRELRSDGIGIIYVSHRLEEIFELTDRVTVLRDGEHVTTVPTAALTRERLIELMVGRSLEQEFPPRSRQPGEPRLVVRGLGRAGVIHDVSFDVRRGEVLGLTGLVGSGRTELARLIFGADRPDGGEIRLDGRLLDIHAPIDAIRSGISLLTEDRKSQGLVLLLSVRQNFALPNLGHWSRAGFVGTGRERRAFERYVSQLSIKISDQEQPAKSLSGGNQQKVLLARWLESQSEVVIFDEPTRGIDVGAKYEIYLLINRLAAEGKAILMISSELPEVLGMSDRILVMHDGRIAGEIRDATSATQEQIMELATGRARAHG